MSGERDLATVLRTMTITRRPGTYVYVAVPNGAAAPAPAAATIVEDEATTVVLERGLAEASGSAWSFEAAWLTVEVHTALDGVGLTAVLARALADAGMACNVLAGFYHDHLLVPADRADDALRALSALRVGSGTQ